MQRLEKKRKDHLAYLPYTDSAITHSSALSANPDHVLLTGRGAFVSIVLDNATYVRGIFLRHAWSGKILVYVNDEITDCVDLYSPRLRSEAITLLDSGTPVSAVIKLVVIGKNELSAADQLVFKGIQIPLPPVATRPQSATAEPVPTGGADAAFVEVHAKQFDKWMPMQRPRVIRKTCCAGYSRHILSGCGKSTRIAGPVVAFWTSESAI